MVKLESKSFSLTREHEYDYIEKVTRPRIGRPQTKKIRGKRIDYYSLSWSGSKGFELHRLPVDLGEALEKSDLPVEVPIYLGRGRVMWAFQGRLYTTAGEDDLAPDEVEALIKEKENKKRVKIARAKAVAAMADSLDRKGKREPIPRDLKVAVWQRDEGKCSQCGSNVQLEFDHIVPLAMGGSNTERNLQLLCAQCNREKGASL